MTPAPGGPAAALVAGGLDPHPPPQERQVDPDADGARIPAGVVGRLVHAGEIGSEGGGVAVRGEPPLGEPSHAREHGGRRSPHPDRDRTPLGAGPHRAVDAVVAPLERHLLLRPERPHQGDLLLDDAAAPAEVDAERLVLDGVPPDADAEPESSPGELRQRRGLLRHQQRLPLGEHQHVGHELQPLRARREVSEEQERLVERRLVGVGGAPAIRAVGIDSEHVVEGEQVRVARLLHVARKGAQRRGIAFDLGLREDGAELNESPPHPRRTAPHRHALYTPDSPADAGPPPSRPSMPPRTLPRCTSWFSSPPSSPSPGRRP